MKKSVSLFRYNAETFKKAMLPETLELLKTGILSLNWEMFEKIEYPLIKTQIGNYTNKVVLSDMVGWTSHLKNSNENPETVDISFHLTPEVYQLSKIDRSKKYLIVVEIEDIENSQKTVLAFGVPTFLESGEILTDTDGSDCSGMRVNGASLNDNSVSIHFSNSYKKGGTLSPFVKDFDKYKNVSENLQETELKKSVENLQKSISDIATIIEETAEPLVKSMIETALTKAMEIQREMIQKANSFKKS